MKKQSFIPLISFLVLSFSACSGGKKPVVTPTPSPSVTPTPSETPTPTPTPTPSPSLTAYDLELTINVENIGATFHDIQFVYNYDNKADASSYVWGHTISTSKQSQYKYTVEDLDISQTLYFKIYMWDSSLDDIYIGDGNNNFVLTPTGTKVLEIEVDFTYPTAGGNASGTYKIITPENRSTKMTYSDQTVEIYKNYVEIAPIFDYDAESFTASYQGENIRIDDKKIVGLKAGTTTEVTLTSKNGLVCKFNVKVAESKYKATTNRDSKWASGEGGWFVSNKVEEISTLGKDFMHGIDISSAKALYDNGSKFFDKNGNEQSLFYLLKDNGINWIRLKLFNNPYTSHGTSYGCGEGSLENVLWMAHEVKSSGLKFLLDFHYSDYWTHPGQQILPKAWKDVSSSDELATLVETYTKETLTTLKNNNCLPDMVQLGNEISSGTFLQKPGNDSETFSGYENTYTTGRSNLSDSIKGTSGSANMIKYLSAAARGVDAVSTSIKKVIHWAKGSTFSATVINNFYNALSSVNYDYAGLSLYPYYCVPTGKTASTGGIDTLNDVLSSLNINKPWFVAEISYPFTGESWVYENNFEVTKFIINNWSTDSDVKDIETMMSNYPFTPAGQAKMIRDVTFSVNKYNGLGLFYWEGAWIPNRYVGWAGSGSPCSWSNQGFFSYDGKAIGNLDLFAQMSPYID